MKKSEDSAGVVNASLVKTEAAVPEKSRRVETGVKMRGAEKVARIPVKVIATDKMLRKPDWIRVRVPATPRIAEIKQKLRKHKLHTVCEEAACPNFCLLYTSPSPRD